MAEMYCKNLPLSKDLDVQESMHGEDLLSMVANILVQVCMLELILWQCPVIFSLSHEIAKYL